MTKKSTLVDKENTYMKGSKTFSSGKMPKKIARMGAGPLERLFGSSMARLIDFFVIHANYEYSKTEIAECAEVSIRTVLRALPYLEEHSIVKHTRTVGNAEMYQTNTDSPIIKGFHKAAQAIADVDVDKELESQEQEKEERIRRKSGIIQSKALA